MWHAVYDGKIVLYFSVAQPCQWFDTSVSSAENEQVNIRLFDPLHNDLKLACIARREQLHSRRNVVGE